MKKLLVLLLLSLSLIGTTSAYIVETHTLKLKALNSCESCNLQGANFSGAKLRNADISGATLCNTETP